MSVCELHSSDDKMINDTYEIADGTKIGRGNRSTRRRTAPSPIYST